MIFGSLSQLRRLKKNQYLSGPELRALQEKKLRDVVAGAYNNVAYYRGLFDKAGIKPADIKTLDDIRRIPITTKKDLQSLEDHEKIAAGTDAAKCVIKHTSGSTGQPLKIFLSPAERDFQILLNLRILLENGMRLTDRMTYLINPHRFPESKYWFQHAGILRREYLSVFDYPEKHMEALAKTRPDIIYGYPSNLTLLALLMKEKGIKEIKPNKVFSVAEALEPRSRGLINSIMKVDACDILGTIELGDIAWQCGEHSGYHISADAVIVEFLRDGEPVRPGDEGKIVCTSLYGHTMPFIRYAVNDTCVPSDRTCSCGRTLPMMDSIKGRANDFITLPGGQVIASCFLVIIMQDFHDVAQYRIVQEDEKKMVVSLVKGSEFKNRTPEAIRDEIRKATNDSLDIEVEIVDELTRDRSGKIRTVISKLNKDIEDRFSVC